MIALSSLTRDELAQLVDAMDLINSELAMLIEHGILNEDDGVDLNELFEAVFTEDEQRALENAEFTLEQSIRRGHVEKVIRPDGEIGYTLTDDGLDYVEGVAS